MNKHRGFTLLEILLVVAIIAILAGIVILAINPKKQLADANNTRRWADVNTILNAVYQYAIDHNGTMISTIPTGSNVEICKKGAANCNALVDLGDLLTDEKYLVDIPIDPSGSTNGNGTGYLIGKSVNNRVTVIAPNGENGITISVSK